MNKMKPKCFECGEVFSVLRKRAGYNLCLLCGEEEPNLHPCGIPLNRMQWPFKTDEERKLIAKYMQKIIRQSRAKALSTLPQADF